jgi:hypothetical protein
MSGRDEGISRVCRNIYFFVSILLASENRLTG